MNRETFLSHAEGGPDKMHYLDHLVTLFGKHLPDDLSIFLGKTKREINAVFAAMEDKPVEVVSEDARMLLERALNNARGAAIKTAKQRVDNALNEVNSSQRHLMAKLSEYSELLNTFILMNNAPKDVLDAAKELPNWYFSMESEYLKCTHKRPLWLHYTSADGARKRLLLHKEWGIKAHIGTSRMKFFGDGVRVDGGYPHPFVSSENICFGDHSRRAVDYCTNGDLKSLLTLFEEIMTYFVAGATPYKGPEMFIGASAKKYPAEFIKADFPFFCERCGSPKDRCTCLSCLICGGVGCECATCDACGETLPSSGQCESCWCSVCEENTAGECGCRHCNDCDVGLTEEEQHYHEGNDAIYCERCYRNLDEPSDEDE